MSVIQWNDQFAFTGYYRVLCNAGSDMTLDYVNYNLHTEVFICWILAPPYPFYGNYTVTIIVGQHVIVFNLEGYLYFMLKRKTIPHDYWTSVCSTFVNIGLYATLYLVTNFICVSQDITIWHKTFAVENLNLADLVIHDQSAKILSINNVHPSWFAVQSSQSAKFFAIMTTICHQKFYLPNFMIFSIQRPGATL